MKEKDRFLFLFLLLPPPSKVSKKKKVPNILLSTGVADKKFQKSAQSKRLNTFFTTKIYEKFQVQRVHSEEPQKWLCPQFLH